MHIHEKHTKVNTTQTKAHYHIHTKAHRNISKHSPYILTEINHIQTPTNFFFAFFLNFNILYRQE